MKVAAKTLDGGRVSLTVEVSPGEAKPFLHRAAQRLSKEKTIAGFRPGKTPYDIVVQQLGPDAIYQEAIQELVTKTVWDAVREQKLETVGSPEIAVEKLAADNPVVYTATVALVPNVTLSSWRDIRIPERPITVTDADVDRVIEELRAMQAKEALVLRPAHMDDRVEVNFEVRRNGAMIEGGKGTKYPLVLGTGTMIPGFEDQIMGMSASGKKNFTLKFPTPYMQKELEGREAEFSVEMVSVYERTLPEPTDAWAEGASGKTLLGLRTLIRENLTRERQQQEDHRREEDLVDRLLERASFSALPSIMLQSEIGKMVMELRHDVERRGMEWEKYLQSLGKTEEQLRNGLVPGAEKRVKGALVLRTLTRELSITVPDGEIDALLERQKETHHDDAQALENLSSPDYRRYLTLMLTNRKLIQHFLSPKT